MRASTRRAPPGAPGDVVAGRRASKLGHVHLARGELDPAREAGRRRCTQCARPPRRDPDGPERMRRACHFLGGWPTKLHARGEPARALAGYEESLRHLRDLATRERDQLASRRDLAELLDTIARLRRTCGDPEGARAADEERQQIEDELPPEPEA
ncbi:MAG: hypothetical protein R3A51_08685 [Nannocystaceae bacterium]